jgi:hypothetical protein
MKKKFIGIITVATLGVIMGLVARVEAIHVVGTPEIDPGAHASAIALLACGVLILTGKRKRTDCAAR